MYDANRPFAIVRARRRMEHRSNKIGIMGFSAGLPNCPQPAALFSIL